MFGYTPVACFLAPPHHRWMLVLDILLGVAGLGAILSTASYRRWRKSGVPTFTVFIRGEARNVTQAGTLTALGTYLRACFLFLTAIYTLSPILRTLTQVPPTSSPDG